MKVLSNVECKLLRSNSADKLQIYLTIAEIWHKF
jgi:hypothetical protein